MLKRMCDEDLILNCNKSDIVVNACLGPHFPEANASGKCSLVAHPFPWKRNQIKIKLNNPWRCGFEWVRGAIVAFPGCGPFFM